MKIDEDTIKKVLFNYTDISEWKINRLIETMKPSTFVIIPKNKDGTLKHIYKDGARYHVEWWDSKGVHCSEKNCEINKKEKIR